MSNISVPDWVRRIRLKNNLTQAQLAKKLGVSTTTIANYEQGKTKPNQKFVIQQLSKLDK